MCVFVYFGSIVNEKNGYCHIEIMISAARMLGGVLPFEKFRKNVQFGASWYRIRIRMESESLYFENI